MRKKEKNRTEYRRTTIEWNNSRIAQRYIYMHMHLTFPPPADNWKIRIAVCVNTGAHGAQRHTIWPDTNRTWQLFYLHEYTNVSQLARP